MTTFAFTITLLDSEVKTVETALILLLEQCETKINEGKLVPYFAHRIDAKLILKRLYTNGTQMSGNNLLGVPPTIK